MTTEQPHEAEHYECRRARERLEQAQRRLGDAVVNRPARPGTPALTAEGWLVIDTEYRNDDPHVMDDCWHRGPYWVYSVRGTSIRVESQPNDGIGAAWDRLESAMRAAGLDGFAEVLGKAAEGLGYRRLVTILSDADLAELKRRAEESAAKYADEPYYGD